MPSYTIVSADTIEELEKKVCKYLQMGWKCQGGVYIIDQSSAHYKYYQAVINENVSSDNDTQN